MIRGREGIDGTDTVDPDVLAREERADALKTIAAVGYSPVLARPDGNEPACTTCGQIMGRLGSGYKCPGCGSYKPDEFIRLAQQSLSE